MKKIDFNAKPVTSYEKEYFYSSLLRKRPGCIGHLRGDLDSNGVFLTSWDDHNPEIKTQAFKEEFDQLVGTLRKGVLKNRKNLVNYCYGGDTFILDRDSCGFRMDSYNYAYYIRLNPNRGEYSYIYAYDRDWLGNDLLEKMREAI